MEDVHPSVERPGGSGPEAGDEAPVVRTFLIAGPKDRPRSAASDFGQAADMIEVLETLGKRPVCSKRQGPSSATSALIRFWPRPSHCWRTRPR
jgi:hypothetical protein